MERYSQDWLTRAGEMLQRLPSVYAARLLSSEDGAELEAIHLLSGIDRNPKQIVRDVQSALSAAYGLDIDHRIVSVAQMIVNPLENDAARETSRDEARPQYRGLCVEEFAHSLTVRVSLEYRGEVYEGAASGQSGILWRDQLAAQAALDAISHLPGQQDRYALLNVQTIQVQMLRLSVVLVQCCAEEIILTGAAPVEEGSLHGVVRATLDAVNRNLSGRLSSTNS